MDARFGDEGDELSDVVEITELRNVSPGIAFALLVLGTGFISALKKMKIGAIIFKTTAGADLTWSSITIGNLIA